LERDLLDIYGLGYFDPVRFEVAPGERDDLLRIRAPRRLAGLNTLQLGLDIESDFEGGSEFTLAARYQRLAVNGAGAEWRNDLRVGARNLVRSEFYQPLDRRLRYYASAYGSFEQESRTVTVDGDAISDVRLTTWGGGIDLGKNLARWGKLRVGVFRGVADAAVRVGVPLDLGDHVDVTELDCELAYDTLDSPSWPSRGGRGSLRYIRLVEELGGRLDDTYFRADASWTFSAGRHRFVPGFEAGFAADDPATATLGFELGGLFRLSGFRPGELFDREGLLGRLTYYRQLNRKILAVIPAGWYVGASLESGNVFGESEPIHARELLFGASVFLGVDTPLGPVLVGAGYSQPNANRFYLSFGRSFF
jgi:NTE family protein